MPLSSLNSDQLRQLIEATASITWALEADAYVMNVPEWGKLTGQTPEEIEGDGWLDAVHPDDRERTKAAWQTAISHGQNLNTDFRVKCADSVYRWFNGRGTALRTPEGDIERWVGLCLEIPGLWRFRGAEDVRRQNGEDDQRSVQLDSAAVRAARAMLNWSAADLAERSGVSISTIRRFEGDEDAQFRKDSLDRIKSAFLAEGLRFVEGDGVAIGVRWATREAQPAA